MISLKKYTKKQILSELKHRFEKIASLLDESDYEDKLQQVISWLDQIMFNPRYLLIKPEDIIQYNGGNFADVTNLKIDVINTVYFADTYTDQMNTILPEVGLMPFICGTGNFTNLNDISTYLQIRTNLNMMARQMDLDGDYELWPRDEQGRQLLQLRNKSLTRVEFLPNLDREDSAWYLYDNEYSMLKELLFAECNLFNAEMQLSASALGVGKESEKLISYWQTKIDNIKKQFTESTMITAMP